MSQRRACEIVQLHRSVCRYQSKKKSELELIDKIKTIAAERPRFGYPRIHALLQASGICVNRKRVYRLYRTLGLAVRKRGRRKYFWGRLTPKEEALHLNQRWSMDFVHDTLSNGRKIRTLNIIDDCSRECLAIELGYGLPSERVIDVLERLRHVRGLPKEIVIDNGPEFTSKRMIIWACNAGVNLHFIKPGKPTQNAFVETFYGRFRDECLNQHWFTSFTEANKIIQLWRHEYNNLRPHSALNNLTPAQFAELKKQKEISGQNATTEGKLQLVS